MLLNRRTSQRAQVIALLALALACARCGSDTVDTGASSNAGSPAHAGTTSSTGGRAGSAASEHDAGGNDEGGASGGASTLGGAGGEAAGQGGTSDELVDVIPDFNGCVTANYEDQSEADAARIISIAARGLSFSPPCLTIRAGQTVRWQGSLSAHPLAPGNPDNPNAGSSDSPIRATSSGQSVEFTFPDAGTFPYYCELHSFADGQGMAGVVHVKR